MTPSLFSFGRKRRKAASWAKEREAAGAPHRWAPPPAPSAPPVAEPDVPDALPELARPVPEPPLTEKDGQRRERIEAALEAWRSELVDLGGVASLDDIAVVDGVVDLTAAHPSGLAQLYAGRTTQLSSLIRERAALGDARQSLREVASRTELLARRFGVAPVYLAIGVATWNETVSASGTPDNDGGPAGASGSLAQGGGLNADERAAAAGAGHGIEEDRTVQIPQVARIAAEQAAQAAMAAAGFMFPEDSDGPRVRTVNAPVLLRPVRLASATADATLALEPSIEVNPVLIRALRRYHCATDVEAIAQAALSEEGFTPRSALARIGAVGRQYLPGFEFHERLVVGAFVHPGQALVEDFDAVVERSRTSALVAALAGDEGARTALEVDLPDLDLTDRAPEAERGVGDLDPAQLAVVEAVGTGANLLVEAPPGSDVPGTLAAVFADAAAMGRTVVHVPATGADGHAVAAAMREAGAGSMVIDLTEDPAWRQHACEAIREALGVQPPALDVGGIIEMREHLQQVRSRLDRYVGALHRSRQPWGVSAFEALQTLAELTGRRSSRATTRVRVSPDLLERLDEEGLERARGLLHRGHALGVFTPEVATSAWNGIAVSDMDEATDALVHLRALGELLPGVQRHVEQTAQSTGLARAGTLSEWMDQLGVLDGVRESLDVFVPEVFERSAADMVAATATRRWREEHHVTMDGARRRRFTRQAKDLVRPGRVVNDLHGELVKVQRCREAWRRYDPDGGWPRLPHGLDEMTRAAARAHRAVEEVQPILARTQDTSVLVDYPLDELVDYVNALAADDLTAQRLPEVNRIRAELEKLGLGPFVEDLAQRGVEEDRLDSELTYCWWASVLAYILREDPDIGGLDARALAELSSRLRDLDAAQSQSLPGPVAQAYARRVRAAVEADKDDARALYIALARDDGVPLREILAAHPVALLAKPVWIIPPTLVPQVLDPMAVVDLVVMDASGHLPVSQVLPTFVRAEQVLVVGDPRRSSSGMAGELGPLLPSVTLPTFRNTLDAGIAAFLSSHGYQGAVDAIPSPPGEGTLSLDLVDGRGMPAPGQTAVETVSAEVDRVVDLVIDRALTRPEESLGVVALNTLHADAVRSAVAQAVAGSPALERFFSPGADEPFVVVDLSGARALRRDHVIVTVGYAKTPHGRTIHSFGAISDHDGMVGLVEALCASRGRTQVVSCLAADDIDPERLRSAGAQLLREVLARAEAAAVPGGSAGRVPDRLLVDLAEHLWRKGLSVVPATGWRGRAYPLAIGHPDYPDELLVAVLTDDTDYVAEPSLRRRDRHRVERLEQRGWRVHIAYSVGVFVDPEAEADRVEELVLAELVARQEARAVPAGETLPDHLDDVEPTLPAASGSAGAASRGSLPGAPVPATPEAPVAAGRAPGATPPAPAPEPSDPTAVPWDNRVQRPPIAQGLPLQAYSDDQLDDLVAWIRSDGVTRGEEEEIEELRAALALRRRGSGIDAVLTNAVRRAR
ncbi:DNA helicase [Actinomyces lilanjuaniae]|uniref:DNA helicase n=1 Tax=Actinomyces lilanjuaniae TaxID=2321394 RepID=A0ABN5PQ06_9ACTO|nr:DNA helicase [Actinomyces lilanjuaniae]AYD90450.1 DNA helicase [Actinomyces lilanjuaniae]